ncbi:TIGR03620 family F420-dependent LLM class oxidoreductase [Pseudonocardia sp. CA-107938]|uniref:TIGR03620 family F420-dependent LLM class oxidoreductase n=1 Tax=Pseudonocardia sp. CA-107938 TaxID=3240021 RepID=UPI003D8B005A
MRSSTPIGISLGPVSDGTHLRQAPVLDELGFSSLWIAGGQLDRLDHVDDLLRATSSARIGTGVVPLGRYSAADVVALAARVGTDRFVAGLGGPQSARPVTDLLPHLDALDAGGFGPEQRLLAALGPRKLELARDRAAGALTLLTTPAHTAEARSVLGPDRRLVVHQFVVDDGDAVRARATARPTVGFLVGVGGYRASLRREGMSDVDIDTVSDRLLDAVVAHGSRAAVAERIAAHAAAGADEVVLSVLAGEGEPDLLATARRWMAAEELEMI